MRQMDLVQPSGAIRIQRVEGEARASSTDRSMSVSTKEVMSSSNFRRSPGWIAREALTSVHAVERKPLEAFAMLGQLLRGVSVTVASGSARSVEVGVSATTIPERFLSFCRTLAVAPMSSDRDRGFGRGDAPQARRDRRQNQARRSSSRSWLRWLHLDRFGRRRACLFSGHTGSSYLDETSA